ncbi:MAG TPA: hypothetical protein VKA14_00075 [Gammaproteobacteria bacterium]|nr:hypothetical protein [Gammaproteobacteria bacterium]
MKLLKTVPLVVAALMLTACGGGSSDSASNGSNVSGVSTASQMSVVTAK